MTPRDTIRALITPAMTGIEIRPAQKPMAPKKEGYRCLVLDQRSRREVLDALRHAKPPISFSDTLVEEIDLHGPPDDIQSLFQKAGFSLGSLDYVISPHNLEHLPNPIAFFRQCKDTLSPGGRLFITLPDRRACFDYFRPMSTLAEIVAADFENRTRPSWTQIFEHRTLHARLGTGDRAQTSFPLGTLPESLSPQEDLESALAEWRAFNAEPDHRYRDAHCWTFSPASLELVLEDLRFLGLLGFLIEEITQAGDDNNEIYLCLRKPAGLQTPEGRDTFYRRRKNLLARLRREELFFS